MNPQAEDWIKVCAMAKGSWVAESLPPARPGSSSSNNSAQRSSRVGVGVGDGTEGLPSLGTSLCSDVIQQRLNVHDAAGASCHGGGGASGSSSHPVLYELSLDQLALIDCGECGGTTESPLCSYATLKKLTLNFNRITRIHAGTTFVPLSDLRDLEIDFNALTEFGPLSHNRLEQLSLSHNKISSLSTLSLQRLHTLDVSHNALSKVFASSSSSEVLRLPSLTSLDISHNGLTNVEWCGNLTKLTSLNISHNALVSLQGLQNCLALEELNASHNRLRYVPMLQHTNALRSLGKTLQSLDVSHNDISSLGFFPNGSLTKVWSLSIASNMFHGRKQQQQQALQGVGSGKPLRPGAVEGDDIGDAEYNEEDTASVTTSRSISSSRQGRGRGQSSVYGGSTRRSSMGSSTTTGGTNAVRKTTPDDAVTFLARLAQLFPGLEVLDLTDNNEEIVTDASDLRFLSKCPNLTELKLSGTLALPAMRGGEQQQHRGEAIRAFLPQIEVLDGEVLVRRDPVPMAIEDLESAGITDSATLLHLSRARPTSATAATSAHQLIRPGTSSQSKVNAIHTSKVHDDMNAFVADMQAFLERAEVSRRKVDAVIDHLNANAAWAYGRDTAEPEPLDLVEFERRTREELNGSSSRGGNQAQRDRRGAQLSDSDDEVGENVDCLVICNETDSTATGGGSGATTPKPRPPSVPSAVGPPAGIKNTPGVNPKASPKKRTVSSTPSAQAGRSASVSSERSSGSSLSSQQQQSLPGTANSDRASSSSTSRVVAPRSSSSSVSTSRSALYEESEAYKRIKAQPSTNFRLEQSKFKEEMAKEAQRRREQIEALTKDKGLPAPKSKKSWVNSSNPQQPTLDVSTVSSSASRKSLTVESSTSTISPGKVPHDKKPLLDVNVVSGAETQNIRVSTSTATSPAKPMTTTIMDKQKPTWTAKPTTSTTIEAIQWSSPLPAPQTQQLCIAPSGTAAQVPAINFSKLRDRQATVGSEEDAMIEEERKSTSLFPEAQEDPPLREPSLIVRDLRDVRQQSTPTVVLESSRPNSATPGDDKVFEATLSLTKVATTTSRPTSATLSARGKGGSTSSKVKVGRSDTMMVSNPLLKPSATSLNTTKMAVTLPVQPQMPPPPSLQDQNREAEEEEEEEQVTYFSTEPVSVFAQQQKPQAAGMSLNRRRKPL